MRTDRGRRLGTLLAAAVVVAAGLLAPPAQAADIPAYGSITISDDGTGFVPVWTYDPALWDCSTEVVGPFQAPSAVTVTCRAPGLAEQSAFGCPLMILTTHTSGLAARAGGRAECTTSIDTGVISGVNTAVRSGNLGHAEAITCTAYTNSVALIPPYSVTCNEPGLPTLDAAPAVVP
ncbi:MAG: hypothetical protein QOE45_771 [Frankiaceae bacterium]|jgi:hypothetical protein|nr:hypothetical protein [Frankiaceae bacterium]